MSIFTSLFEFLFGLFERLLGPLLALLFLGGCAAHVTGWSATIGTPLAGVEIRAAVDNFDGRLVPVLAGREIILVNFNLENGNMGSLPGSVADGGQ